MTVSGFILVLEILMFNQYIYRPRNLAIYVSDVMVFAESDFDLHVGSDPVH